MHWVTEPAMQIGFYCNELHWCTKYTPQNIVTSCSKEQIRWFWIVYKLKCQLRENYIEVKTDLQHKCSFVYVVDKIFLSRLVYGWMRLLGLLRQEVVSKSWVSKSESSRETCLSAYLAISYSITLHYHTLDVIIINNIIWCII